MNHVWSFQTSCHRIDAGNTSLDPVFSCDPRAVETADKIGFYEGYLPLRSFRVWGLSPQQYVARAVPFEYDLAVMGFSTSQEHHKPSWKFFTLSACLTPEPHQVEGDYYLVQFDSEPPWLESESAEPVCCPA